MIGRAASRLGLLFVLGACATGVHGVASPAVRTEDRAAARVLAAHVADVFTHRYAPLELKTRALGWDRTRELERLRAALEHAPDPAAMRRAFASFFRSLNDLHTSIEPASGRAVWLGFHLLATEQGARVAWIDPKLSLPLAVGDEVTSIDGRRVAVALAAVAAEERYHSTRDHERAFAEWFLTMRSTSDVETVPQPGARTTLTVRGHDGEERGIELAWRDMDTDGPSERCPYWPKARRSVLHPLGPIAWEAPASSRFQAYVFESGGKSWGFVRLHTYDLPPAAQREAIHELDALIDALQARAGAGIVVDQRGNGGGNYLLAYAMFARLLERPLLPTKQRYLADANGVVGFGPRADLASLAESLERVASDAEAAQALGRIAILEQPFGFAPRDVVTAHGAGRFFRVLADAKLGLTAPHFLLAPETRPDPSRGPVFRGAVVMLTDGMALSAADYVPATLQDNGRAVIFGETTAGAGGDQRHEDAADPCTPETAQRLIAPCTPPAVAAAMQRLGIRGLSYTVTLGEREGGRVIENVGVTPDVPYRITDEDLRTDLAPMRSAILATLRRTAAR